MVGKLVTSSHSETIGFPITTDEIARSDFGLFTTILGVRRYEERFAMSPHDRTITLVEPLRGHPDNARSRLSRCKPLLKDAHAVGELIFFEIVHSIAIACAA